MNTTEIEIKVSGGRVTGAQVLENGTCKLVVEAEMPNGKISPQSKSSEDIFVLVEASKLSLEDAFMKHKPTTDAEKKLKELLEEAIQSGVKDFYRPSLDPSFKKYGGIYYEFGNMPATGKSYNWWKKAAKGFMPERGSRLGTRLEYAAFLGVLIKEMVSEGWSINQAWNAVCNDSKKLGHYWNSKNAKHEFEPTGARKVGRFYDLANTYKILAEDGEAGGFWLAGGSCISDSYDGPLADLDRRDDRCDDFDCSAGWLVLSK